jgi:hypothetical protein
MIPRPPPIILDPVLDKFILADMGLYSDYYSLPKPKVVDDKEIKNLFRSYNSMNKIFNILKMISPSEKIDVIIWKAQRLDRFLSLIKTAIYYSKYLLKQERDLLGVIKYVTRVILNEPSKKEIEEWKKNPQAIKDPLALLLILDDVRLKDFVNVLIELNTILSQEYISKKRLKEVVALINRFETLYNSYVYGS